MWDFSHTAGKRSGVAPRQQVFLHSAHQDLLNTPSQAILFRSLRPARVPNTRARWVYVSAKPQNKEAAQALRPRANTTRLIVPDEEAKGDVQRLSDAKVNELSACFFDISDASNQLHERLD